MTVAPRRPPPKLVDSSKFCFLCFPCLLLKCEHKRIAISAPLLLPSATPFSSAKKPDLFQRGSTRHAGYRRHPPVLLLVCTVLCTRAWPAAAAVAFVHHRLPFFSRPADCNDSATVCAASPFRSNPEEVTQSESKKPQSGGGKATEVGKMRLAKTYTERHVVAPVRRLDD